LSVQLEAFAANTMEYLKQVRDLLLDGVGVPDVETHIAGRHCLIVVRGYDYKADLDVLRPYIREFKPVLIGVDGGADALVEAGYTPDMIIGDMDSVTDDVLRCGAEVVVHAYPDGRAPGLDRVHQLGVSGITFPAAHTTPQMQQAYGGVSVFPTMFFVNRQGQIVKHFVNFQQRAVLESAIQETLKR